MVNIWVALEDIESHPLAIVTNLLENFTPPPDYFQKPVEAQLAELCNKAKHLNYIIKDMKA